ncbi:MAG: outer rane autotransporter barrel domain protein [Xanthobacteraceae bacterium]|jgi:outer membrane autotransporter protein|nr:outer rane autotransporter barrel domain protein [Xanthobacteraceae bacterium]
MAKRYVNKNVAKRGISRLRRERAAPAPVLVDHRKGALFGSVSVLVLGVALLATGGVKPAAAACSGLNTGSATCDGAVAGPVTHTPAVTSTITIVGVPATTITSAGTDYGLYVNPTVGGTTQVITVQDGATINTVDGDDIVVRANFATEAFNVNVTMDGNLNSSTVDPAVVGEGIDISTPGGVTNVTVGATGNINVGGDGIAVINTGLNGSGLTVHGINITNNGEILADSNGIFAWQAGNATNVIVNNGTIGLAGDPVGSNPGVGRGNLGIAASAVDWSGDGPGLSVTNNNDIYAVGTAIQATSSGTADILVQTAAGSVTSSTAGWGIFAQATGTGDVQVNHNGALTAGITGIEARSNTGAITVNTSAGSTVTTTNPVVGYGIFAASEAGPVTVNHAGTVTDGGIYASTTGVDLTDTVTVALTGDVTVTPADRAAVEAYGINGLVTVSSGVDSQVVGTAYGVRAGTSGTAGIDIDLLGDVTATQVGGGSAVYAFTTGASTGIDINIGVDSVISGAGYGVVAQSQGTAGGIILNVDGDVTSALDGVRGEITNAANAANIGVTLGAAGAVVSTTDDGIQAETLGNGAVTVSVLGDVTAGNGSGDAGVQAAVVGGLLTVNTGVASDIDATERGIDAHSFGAGNITMDLSGDIDAGYGNPADLDVAGVFADATSTGDIGILTRGSSQITSERDGIFARTNAGSIAIVANGQIGGFDTTSLSFETVGNNGINALVVGGGATGSDVDVVNNGLVAAANIGINAFNNAAGAVDNTPDINVINFGVIYGEETGVLATSTNGGAFVGNAGILLGGDWDSGSAVEFNTATGGGLTNNGIIASADAAQDMLHDIDALIDNNVTNPFAYVGAVIDGVQDGADDLAVLGSAGTVQVQNNFVMIGRVDLNGGVAGSNFVENNFLWVTTGTNDINGDVENNGWIQTAVDADLSEYTEFTRVANNTWVNNGVISTLDGQEGDWTAITGAGAGVTFNAGPDSLVIQDTFLGAPGSISDVLQIGGEDQFGFDGGIATIIGQTRVFVNDTNNGVGAFNPTGILAIALPDGSFAPDAFIIDPNSPGYDPTYGVIDKGFFDYALLSVQDQPGYEDGFYYFGIPGQEAFQLPSLISGAQSIWHDTTGVWLDRQADLRSYLVNPVVVAAPTTIVSKEQGLITKAQPMVAQASVTPGVWGKALGSWATRDNKANYSILGNNFSYNTSYDQDTYGFIAGADFGKTYGDSAWVFGAMGGYINSKLDFDSSSTSAEYTGGTVGVYATYLSGGFFIDGLFKADFLEMDYDVSSLANFGYTGETSDVTNLGFTIDTGYRFGWGSSAWFEPVATVSYVNTQIDDLNDFPDTTVKFEDGDSLRASIGARVGGRVYDAPTYWVEASATGRFWYEFEGENKAIIENPGDDFAAYDDFDGGFGEVAGSLNWFGKENGWNGFVNASVLFNDDYTNGSGKVGVRYQW